MDFLLENSVAAACAKSVALLAAICVPTAFIVVSTPKSGLNSFVRYAWIAVILAIGKQTFETISAACSSLILNSVFLGQVGLISLQCCSFLAITRFDAQDLIKGQVFDKSDSLLTKVYRTTSLLLNLRGIGTQWQITRLKPFPRFYQRYGDLGKPARGLFLTRQILLIAWQYLFLDFVQFSTFQTPAEDTEKLFGNGKEFVYLNATPEEWIGRFAILSGAMPGRVTMDFVYRTTSFVAVLLGLSSPEKWPPLFGSYFDAYTLRGLWSTCWHQHCRWPLTTISNFICRDVLRLPRPSSLERYVNITLVFLSSGLFHAAIDVYCWRPPTKLPTLAFFGAFGVGIMLEDGVQAVCRRVTGVDTRNKGQKVPLWHRLVGYVWVMVWMAMILPWYLFHSARSPAQNKWIVPFSVVDQFGPEVPGALLGAGGLILLFAVGAEI